MSNKITKKEFYGFAALLKAAWPNIDLGQPVLEFWFECLKDFTLNDLSTGLKKLVMSGETYPPTPGVVARFACGTQNFETKVQSDWLELKQAATNNNTLRQIGAFYADSSSEAKRVFATYARRLIGSTQSDLTYIGADFKKNYAEALERDFQRDLADGTAAKTLERKQIEQRTRNQGGTETGLLSNER